MSDTKYFVNCRGATLNPTYASEWEKSGNFPRITSPFIPYSKILANDVMYFCGATKTANWIHFDSEDIRKQITYLRSIGVNLIRVYSDPYCWAAQGSGYLDKIDLIASICEEKKIYTQWVLFDGYTHDDVSGNGFEYGGYDPSTIPQAISWGLKRWQRCPTIYQHSLMTRHPSSMVTSGNNYFNDMVGTLSSYTSTKVWEVMSDVNILSNETSGYNFLTSAINKLRSIIPASQKITFSVKNLNNFSSTISPGVYPDIYVSAISKTLAPLVDHVCYIDNGSTYLGKAWKYLNALEFSLGTGKPIMVIDSFDKNLDSTSDNISYWSALDIGFITEGMIDRNFGSKPANNYKGIFFDDGQVRNLADASTIISKTLSDGHLKKSVLNLDVQQKSSYDDLTTKYDEDVHTRLSQFYETGENLFSSMMEAKGYFPEYSGVALGYAPIESSTKAKGNGWGIVGPRSISVLNYIPNYSTKNSILQTLTNLGIELASIELSAISYADEIIRDKAAYFRINTLTKLHESLPLAIGHNYYGSNLSVTGLISQANQITLSSVGTPFLPYSNQKLNASCVTPYIGTPRYFSSMAHLDGPYFDDLSECQKPIGFYLRGPSYASGACYYSGTVIASVTATQDVLRQLDWAKYDGSLRNWFNAIYNAYADFIVNLKAYTTANYPNSTIDKFLNVRNNS